MLVYILRGDGTYVLFEGMLQINVTTMLTEQGYTYTIIDEETYQTAIMAFQRNI